MRIKIISVFIIYLFSLNVAYSLTCKPSDLQSIFTAARMAEGGAMYVFCGYIYKDYPNGYYIKGGPFKPIQGNWKIGPRGYMCDSESGDVFDCQFEEVNK